MGDTSESPAGWRPAGGPADVARPLLGLEHAAALSGVGRLLVETLDLAVVGERIVEGLRALLHAPAGSLYRVDRTSGDLVAVAASGPLGQVPGRPLVLPRGTGLAGLAVSEGRPVSSGNVLLDPRLTHTAETCVRIDRAGYRSALSMPLVAKGRVIGVLSVGDAAGRIFGREEIELAQAFADYAAIGLENARLYEEAEHRRREAERIAEALRQSSEMLEALIHSSALGIVVLDADARVRLWNAAAERVFGWTAAEAMGRFLPVIPSDARERFLANFSRTMRGESFSDEVRQRRKDGSPVDIRVSTAPLRDAGGGITGVVAVVEDVSSERRATEALQASEARYRAIVESQTELVCRFRRDGTLTFANDSYCRYFGRSRDGLIGVTYHPVVHPDDIAAVRREIEALGPENRVANVENRVIKPDGEVRWVQWTNVALYDAAGQFIELQAVGRDVTAERQAAARQRFLVEASRILVSSLDYERTLAEVARLAVPALADWCAIDLADPDGSPRRIAAAATDTARGAPSEPDRDAAAGPDGVDPAARVLRTGRAELYAEVPDDAAERPGETLGRLRRRGVRSAMVVPMLVRRRPIGVLTLASGESGRRYGVADLALIEDLASRAALAVENAVLYREAQAASRAKDQFLATLAHELRNPLAPILNALQALDQLGPQGAEADRLRAIMARQTRHVARLVDDLLDVSRISSGKVVLKRASVDLRTVARRSLRALEASGRAQFHEVSFAHDPDPVIVDGDVVRLEQVLGNLLDNAVKYSPPGGPLRLAVGVEGDQAVVRVADRGIGLAPEMLETIFQPFAQADTSLDRPRGGLGLGLAVVRGLVEQHGGTITAHSAGLGRGAEFVVRLPLAAGAAASASSAPAPSGAPGVPARRIVLVEDYADAREALRMLLALEGHSVETAADGAEGVALIARLQPDVALVDIGLPGLDGYEVARQVRATPAGKRVYLIAATGYGQAYDRRQAMEAGFDLHLVKPIDVEELSRALADLGPPALDQTA